ncbi:hypothetical protein niasHT_027572 [Heterodera trifolii]|uniref:Uncharacterized protein n=1 Tax=Heterodera trifolii TaxID=157864 RepID=A0ABD2K557_9BILA
MSEQQTQNSPEPKNLEIVEEEEETEMDRSERDEPREGQTEDGQRSEGPAEERVNSPSPKEADNGQTDDGGEAIGEEGGEQRRKGESEIAGPSAVTRQSPSVGEAIEVSYVGSNTAQSPLEKTPPKLRIHRVFRSEEGVEIRQCETVADPRLVEQYLKMRMLCSREQLWQLAFDDVDSERDFRAMRRRLQKRFKYYEKKQKLEETAARKKAAAAEKRARETEEEKPDETKKAFAAASLRPSSSAAAVQSPPRPSPPSSSGYSTTTTTSSAADRDRSPAMGVRQSARGTARRPNAGTKRQRYSPGAEALLPQQEARRGKAKQ